MPGLDSYRLDQYRIDGGGGSGNAQPGDVLSGKTFTNDDGEQVGTRELGKKYATGRVTSSSTTRSFQLAAANGYIEYVDKYYFTVSGIGFIPTHIDIFPDVSNYREDTIYDNDFIKSSDPKGKAFMDSNGFRIEGYYAYVDARGFMLPAYSKSVTYNWHAYGNY